MTQPTQPNPNPNSNPEPPSPPALESTSTQQIRVGVALFLIHPHHSNFLLGHRLSPHGKDTLALPGGHLEYDETFEECATRETLEETGLDVEVGSVRFLTAVNSVFAPEGRMQGEPQGRPQGQGQGKGKHYVTIFMVGRVSQADVEMGRGPRVMEQEKCAGWEWVGWEELVEMARREAKTTEDETESGQGTGQGPGRDGKGEARREVKRLFQPLRNLLDQRPGVVPKLD